MFVVAGLFLTVLVTGMVGSVRSGNTVVVPIVLTALGLCVMVVWLFRLRVRMMLRDRTPDRLIAHYHRSVRRIPYGEATAAYLSGLAATFFGDFDRARKELDALEWGEYPALYRGHRLYVLAMLALLEKTDYAAALQLAAEGKALEETERGGGLQLLDDVIHVVGGEAQAEAVERLERAANKQSGLVPSICVWALAVHSRRNNQTDKASDYKLLLRRAAPHCVPLRS